MGVLFMIAGFPIAVVSLGQRDSLNRWGGFSMGWVVGLLGVALFKSRPYNPEKAAKKPVKHLDRLAIEQLLPMTRLGCGPAQPGRRDAHAGFVG
jgi:hypothetical protein